MELKGRFLVKYRVLFIGIGSIAKRHIRNLSKLKEIRNCQFEIDILRSGKGKQLDDGIKAIINKEYSYSDAIPNNYDIAFITNPTSMHFQTIRSYSGDAKNMFIEKPVFDGLTYEIEDLGLKGDGKYYVACPLRYSAVLQYVKNNITCNDAFAVRSISSSYLPDWRPGVDYRSTYSAHKDMGGGVSIDLIHEWDYLTWLFGMPTQVYSVIGKYSSLKIDSDDSALYIGTNSTTTFELHLDYYGRKTLRSMQVFLPEETIDADLIGHRISFLKSGKIIDLEEDRDAYQIRELEHFLDIVEGKVSNDNDINHALKVLSLARGEYK